MEISLKNLTAGYILNKKTRNIIIENLNIIFESGKFHFITGVSGSGKSTLLETMSLITKKISGEILFNNINLNNKKNLIEFRKLSGIMFQYSDKQFFNDTIREEIIFNLKRNKLSSKEINSKLKEVVELLNIDKAILKESPFEISGGQKRTVALASIIITYGDDVFILNKNKEYILGKPKDLLFSDEILNKYNLAEPDIYKYIKELKRLGMNNIDGVYNIKELIEKIF